MNVVNVLDNITYISCRVGTHGSADRYRLTSVGTHGSADRYRLTSVGFIEVLFCELCSCKDYGTFIIYRNVHSS